MRLSFFVFLALISQALAQTPARRLTLDEACALALKNNPRVSLDALLPAIAQETATAARAALLPTITGQSSAVAALTDSRLSAGALNNPIIFNRVSFGVSGSQLLTDFGRSSNLSQSAKLRAESQGKTAQASRAQILLAVHRAFYTALRARRLMDAAAAAPAQSGDDLEAAQAALAAATMRNDYLLAIADLSAVLGFGEPQELDLVDATLPTTVAAPAPPQELIATALRNRPEVAALRLERDASERFAKAEAKLAAPVIMALGSTGYAPAHTVRLNHRFAAAGVTLNVPIFNGHLFDARRRESEIRSQAATQRLKELEIAIGRDVAAAALAAQTAYLRLVVAEKQQQRTPSATTDARLAAARCEYRIALANVGYQTGTLR